MTALKLRSLPTLMAVLMMCLAAVSCSDHEFKVKGKIDGAREQAVIMEKSDFQGRWIVVDSTHISPSGTFSFKAPSPGAPEVYRLSIDGDYIYFPVDSVETVSVFPGLRATILSPVPNRLKKWQSSTICFHAPSPPRVIFRV